LLTLPNKKKLEIIVIGTGLSEQVLLLALGELGYSVKNILLTRIQPERAHSVGSFRVE